VASIKILDQTYTLPAIATEHFCALQDQVQAQQQVIQTGLRPQPRLWGMIPRPPLHTDAGGAVARTRPAGAQLRRHYCRVMCQSGCI